MAFTAYFAKASKRLSSLIKADIDFLSAQSYRRRIDVVLPATTASSTTYSVITPLGMGLIPESGYVVFRTKPVIDDPGTIVLLVEYVAADGSTATTLVNSQTLEGKTDMIPFTITLAATPSMLGTGSIRTSITCSAHTVSTAQVGGGLVLICKPIEDTVLSESQT